MALVGAADSLERESAALRIVEDSSDLRIRGQPGGGRFQQRDVVSSCSAAAVAEKRASCVALRRASRPAS